MLVFTRKVGEAIVINGEISVTIIRVGPNDVRLGIIAPEEVPVFRTELGTTGANEISNEIGSDFNSGEGMPDRKSRMAT